MRDARWVELSLANASPSDIKPMYKEARAFARTQSAQKIESTMSVASMEKWEKPLKDLGFRNGLVELRKPIPQGLNPGTLQGESTIILQNTVKSDQLRPILEQQALVHYELEPNYYLAPSEINWSSLLAELEQERLNPDGIQLVALTDQQVSGLLWGEIIRDVLHLWDAVVDQSLRSQGIGTALMNQCFMIAQKRNVPLQLETWRTQRSFQWYQKLGFSVTHQSFYQRISP